LICTILVIIAHKVTGLYLPQNYHLHVCSGYQRRPPVAEMSFSWSTYRRCAVVLFVAWVSISSAWKRPK